MCVNSCCAFVGVLENERKCKFCKEDRYYSNGPKQPQDFNSFLYPLIQEMKLLQDGILCYDGNKKEYFTLRAHILAWTGDLPALSKILYLTGHNSYSGCRFCNLRGTLNEMNRHVYYPLQQNIDPIRLPIRTHDEMLTSINQIEHLKGDRRETYIRNCGIKGKSILFELSSIKFPRSFPVDIMHLFFENIAPHMFRHWIGKFYPKNDERNSNNYTISSKTWIEIAVEWANWIILFSLPLLKGRLPQSYFLGWSNFVEAVQLCIQPRIDFEDLDKIRNLLIQFYNHYASSYGLEGERLPVYLISFHYSLHIGDCIEDLGPCRGFWQFPMERYCGMLIPLISSRKLPYVNLINNVLLQERFKYLQFLPTYDEKVFSNFKEKEKAWPSHRQCYAAIFQKNARDIRDIEESYMKYGKLRTKDGNIVSSKWWKKENDSSRNDYCVAINLTIDEQEEETFGQVEYFMLHNMQNQERMFAYIRKIKKLEKNIGNLKFFDCFGPLQYVEVIGIDRTVGFFEVYDKKIII
ncbi:transposase domain-containing protein [Rhizophagus irregularis DAOM 181602=DAOM 197198]|nr:transposase domain-containing protein [Rhizophagus irregularis DAOM 181602=DAOM 197198]